MKASLKAKLLKALKKHGLNDSDYAHDSWCPNGIALCTQGDNAHLVGNYYSGGAGYNDFGVNEALEAILEKHGCQSEWYNAAVLCVYE